MNIFRISLVLVTVAIFSSYANSNTNEKHDLKLSFKEDHDNILNENFKILNADEVLLPSVPIPQLSKERMTNLSNITNISERQSSLACEYLPSWHVLSVGEYVRFKSPNYPKKYPNNELCGFTIASLDPDVRILITCSKFRLQKPKRKTCGDFLSFNTNVYCGKVVPKEWVSTGNQVYIWFLTNKKKNFKGFACKARAIPSSAVDTTKCSPNPVVNTLTEGTSITLTSPKYPRKYPKNELCGWYFQSADWSIRMSVTCDVFKLQNPSGNKCIDSFTLNLDKYCGSNGPLGWVSDSGQTSLWFSTNKKKQAKGFRCTATAVGPSSYGIGASTDCKCGRVNRGTRIVGGQTTEVNEYPWQVSFVERDTNDTLCGGSIINDRWILTAAHCTSSMNDFQVIVGSHDWTNPPASFQRLEYETYIYHPFYDSSIQDNDLSLVKLVDRLDFSDPAVAPICPPEPSNTYYGVNATVTGWGLLGDGESDIQPDELQEVDITTITNTECAATYIDYVITDNMLCAGHPDGGKDSCQGDSGGPLITQEGDHYVQIGVVSWGVGCGDANYPGVYATIANQLEWITNIVSEGETCAK